MSPRPFGATSTDDPGSEDRRRARMVDRQLRARGIRDERVLAAMAQVPRERFVPASERRRAYRDGALAIGRGQTISQPWVVAAMAVLLDAAPDARVLEIGTGSGYAAAVLSRLCAHVLTIERHPDLAAGAAAVLAELGFRNVEVRTGDGREGAPDRAPFGGISVAATVDGGPPPALLDQLAPGACYVGPVRRDGEEQLLRVRDGREERFGSVRFVPLLPGVASNGPA